MLLSRFWYFVLAAAGAVSLIAFLIAHAGISRRYDRNTTDQLRRDRFELEIMLKLDARARLDAIAPIAAHEEVRLALAAASGGGEGLSGDAVARLSRKLADLNRQLEGMSGTLLFAVDTGGSIVGRVGNDEAPAGAGLGAFPLVERALAGNIRDDVWVYNNVALRMAARPVIHRGQYVGAIVHGMPLDDELARRLSERLHGPTIAFFMRDRVVARHMAALENAPRAEDIETPLRQALQDETLQGGGRTDPMDLAGDSRAVYSLMVGSASYAQVGYAIARPREVVPGALDILLNAAHEDTPTMDLVLAAAAFGAAFLFGMMLVWLERDRPLSKLRNTTHGLAAPDGDRLSLGDFGGGYRKMAEAVNHAIDAVAEKGGGGAPRKAADLDEILGPTPEEGERATPQFFAFAEDRNGPGAGDAPQAPPQAPPQVPVQAAPKGPGIPPPPAAGAPPPPPAGRGAAFPPPPGQGGAAKPGWGKGTLMGMGASGAAPAGAGPIQAPALGAAALGMPADPDEDLPTTIGTIPPELLAEHRGVPPAQAAPAAPPAAAAPPPRAATPGPMAAPAGHSAEQSHFREVFDQYVGTKRQCGEPTASLTFAKFSQTLQKNRDTIMAKHGAKEVRFTVYVKAGKAALKATPVKS